ncbi:MAG: type II toxin-antitoxin system VapC family toxin [Desulfurococcales archaeon]|nr:type II toxin-antitoxin system VapC family toxin [Desulfurococcales archaeon]
MTILDTSIVIDRVRGRKPIVEDITVVTLVEYPRIVYYKHFRGNVIFPVEQDYLTAHKLQLLERGQPQAFADLLIASIALNRGEMLVTRDEDFRVIAKAASELGYEFKLELKL